MPRPSQKSFSVVLVAALGTVIVAELVLLGMGRGYVPHMLLGHKARRTLSAYANAIISACSGAKHRPSCYDTEIPKLMDRISMEEAFEVTRLVQERDQSYWYCHVLGHALSATETQRDLSQWKTVAARCPSGICSNGCLHGAFQERFRASSLPEAEVEMLVEELKSLCEPRQGWSPTGLEQASCYHALGHLAMYVTDADIEKATTICEAVAVHNGRDSTQLCFDGAYMQLFQPLEPEDIALVEGKVPEKDTLGSYCSRFSGKRRNSCWTEGWPLYLTEITTPEGLQRFCSMLPWDAAAESRCYDVMFYVLPTQFRFETKTITSYCGSFSDMRLKERCFANAASRMIETDWRLVSRATEICGIGALGSASVGDACYDELMKYSTYNYHPGSEAFYNLCNGLPDPWQSRCIAGALSRQRGGR